MWYDQIDKLSKTVASGIVAIKLIRAFVPQGATPCLQRLGATPFFIIARLSAGPVAKLYVINFKSSKIGWL